MTDDFHPWRRPLRFLACRPADIRPRIPQLSFIADPLRSGMTFRRGLFPIPEADFAAIATAMNSTWIPEAIAPQHCTAKAHVKK